MVAKVTGLVNCVDSAVKLTRRLFILQTADLHVSAMIIGFGPSLYFMA